MDADVINLVEVEGCQALNAVAPTSETSEQPPIGSYEAYLLTGTDTYLKQQVGLLTRITPWQPLERSSARETYPVDDQSTCGAYGESSTDLSKHFELLQKFKNSIRNGFYEPNRALKTEDQTLLMQMIIKMADVNNPAKERRLSQEWTKRISEEWYRQGETEAKLNFKIVLFEN